MIDILGCALSFQLHFTPGEAVPIANKYSTNNCAIPKYSQDI